MSEVQLCPWCQTEIVWGDEEPGAECPHCFNELNDYRTLTVDLDAAEDGEDGLDLFEYEQKARAYLRHQEAEQTMDCDQCQEPMVLAGELDWASAQFRPRSLPGLPPFLTGPLRVALHVCPSCFQVKTALPEDMRMAVIKKLEET